MSDSSDLTKLQHAIAIRLQTKWLEHMEKLLDQGTASPTDLSTLERFLRNNGWTLDPRNMPKGIQDHITSHVSPTDLDEDDVVIGAIRKKA